MRITIYYLSDDINNQKEQENVEYLNNFGRVILITTTKQIASNKIKTFVIKPYESRQWMMQNLWGKICVVFSKMANCAGNHNFADRNIYVSNIFFRKVINFIWEIKKIKWINNNLPRYDTLFFSPFEFLQKIKRWGLCKNKKNRHRVIVHDSVLVRIGPFSSFLAWGRVNGIKTIANVKSWDNPQYAQFSTNADGYLVWSKAMRDDIEEIQEIKNSNFCYWGPRQFINFISIVDKLNSASIKRHNIKHKKLSIGYAAAFGDLQMGTSEVEIIMDFAVELEKALPDARILFRPYPAALSSIYEPLSNCKNVVFHQIEGNKIDRFGDGREFVRFGSESERINYLNICDYFISLATTFTIEAAIANIPIIHLYMESSERQSAAEKSIFRRIDISSHIIKYYNGNLVKAGNYREIVNLIKTAPTNDQCLLKAGEFLLEDLGINILTRDSNRISTNVSKLLTHTMS